MKRSLCIQLFTFVVAVCAASAAQACCFFPFSLLNPCTWCYGCGGAYGYGGGYGGCGFPAPYAGGYGYAPAPPVYAPSFAPAYAPAPIQPGCDCTSAAPQPQFSAVQVPVTTYRAVTQYVPQTTYQTQYPWGQQSMAYGGAVAPQAAWAAPTTIGSGYAPSYAAPQVATPYISAPYSNGDISGDHEYPSTSALMPAPQVPMTVRVPVTPASYRMAPRVTNRYSQSVR